MTIVGRPLTIGPSHGEGGWTSVGPGYFETYRIPLFKGRTFTLRDTGASAPVVIVNEALAKQLWPKSDPLKDRIVIGKNKGAVFDEGPRQIVGVVGNIRDGGLNRDPRPGRFIPVSQVTDGITALNARIGPIVWLVRTKTDPHALSSAIENELRKASGGLPVARVRTMDQVVIRSLRHPFCRAAKNAGVLDRNRLAVQQRVDGVASDSRWLLSMRPSYRSFRSRSKTNTWVVAFRPYFKATACLSPSYR